MRPTFNWIIVFSLNNFCPSNGHRVSWLTFSPRFVVVNKTKVRKCNLSDPDHKKHLDNVHETSMSNADEYELTYNFEAKNEWFLGLPFIMTRSKTSSLGVTTQCLLMQYCPSCTQISRRWVFRLCSFWLGNSINLIRDAQVNEKTVCFGIPPIWLCLEMWPLEWWF